MKALLKFDFYRLITSFPRSLLVLCLGLSFFFFDMERNGPNYSNILTPSFAIQLILVCEVGKIIISDKANKVIEYLRAVPISEKDYIMEKCLLQVIVSVFSLLLVLFAISFVEIETNLLKLILLSGALSFIIGEIFIYVTIKYTGTEAFSFPIIIYLLILVMNLAFPQIFNQLQNTKSAGTVGIIALIIGIILMAIIAKLSIRELENYE